MDEIHVHKTKKSICAQFAESPCNSKTHINFVWQYANILFAACAHMLCTGSAFSTKEFFAYVASANRAVFFTVVFALAVSCCWLLKVLICTTSASVV